MNNLCVNDANAAASRGSSMNTLCVEATSGASRGSSTNNLTVDNAKDGRSSPSSASDSDVHPQPLQCKVRTTKRRWRHDPYHASVLTIPSVVVDSDDDNFDAGVHSSINVPTDNICPEPVYYHQHQQQHSTLPYQHTPQQPLVGGVSNNLVAVFGSHQRRVQQQKSGVLPPLKSGSFNNQPQTTTSLPQLTHTQSYQHQQQPIARQQHHQPHHQHHHDDDSVYADDECATPQCEEANFHNEDPQHQQQHQQAYQPREDGLRLAMIKFKHTKTAFLYDPQVFGDLESGEMVVTEADRGEDIGYVITGFHEPKQPKKEKPNRICRRANDVDREHLERVRAQEVDALMYCREAVRMAGLSDHMSIVDVEFQADFKRLNVFFVGKKHRRQVDFRELQRHLFRHFRCRIWISNW